MLDQVLGWAAVNSGSRNLAGLERMADLLADAFAALARRASARAAAAGRGGRSRGRKVQLRHGRHLHLTVRPTAPLQLLFTGHMDTVFAADHAFQETRWLEDGVLNGPGVADMKGGLAVMLAALKAVEKSSGADRIGYEIVINSDEEVGSLALRRAARAGGAGQARGVDLRTGGACPTGRSPGRGREAAISRSSSTAAPRMRGAIPKTGATRCSRQPTSRSGWMH